MEAESFDPAKEITPHLDDPSSYYEQYDRVETAISSGSGAGMDSVQHAGMANESVVSGGSGSTENGTVRDIGMEDYVCDTVRNLSQLALRSGMSTKRLRQLITEAMD